MVYCGKASQGCENCRIRRIKCDKVRPECSQCIRASKKCHGYRDQLSLMFRDESKTVVRKARAQWRRSSSGSGGLASALASASNSALIPGLARSTSPGIKLEPLESARLPFPSPSAARRTRRPLMSTSALLLKRERPGLPSVDLTTPLVVSIDPALEEQGIQFYIDRYVLAHPEEPKDIDTLTSNPWMWHPAQREIMAAVGLAGLSNLLRRDDMMTLARQKYGAALRIAARLISNPSANEQYVTMRTVVMLALFEVVRGTWDSLGTAGTHIIGAAALMRSWCAGPSLPAQGVRSLLQLCYSVFIPGYFGNLTLPSTFFDWITYSTKLIDPADRPATDLATLIGRFLQNHTYIKGHVLSDSPRTQCVIQKFLDLEADFDAWESKLVGKWIFRTEPAPHLPHAAVFDGEYHVYHDLWVARILNHYRWARILLNQTIIELAGRFPTASLSLLSAAEREATLNTIRRLARDVLVGAPSHWKHPALDEQSQIRVEIPGRAGSGAAGIPVLVLQMKVAACAPGIPFEYWDWVGDSLQCIWRKMGMLQAYSMIDLMRQHQDALQRADSDGILSLGD